jgi:hypothetical protein
MLSEIKNEIKSPESSTLEEDFASLDKSEELPEVPQASALFSAIINNSRKTEEPEENKFDFSSLTPQNDDFFSGSTKLQNIDNNESESELFAENNDISAFKDNAQEVADKEPEQPTETPNPAKPSFINLFFNGMTRGRHKKEDVEELTAEARVSNSDLDTSNDTEISGDDLEIPAFLRR